MKNKFVLTWVLFTLILFANTSKTMGATYNIDHFSGTTPPPETALINRGASPFASGDTLNFTNSSTMFATSSIGDIGPSATSLTLNGNNKTIDGSNTYAGFSVVAGDTYTFNSINLDHFKNNNGGAIYDNQGTIIVNNSSFTGNASTASIGGGAIYSTATATTTISNSVFDHNYATSTTGGGAFYGRGSITLSNNSFTNNGTNTLGTVTTSKGGAFYNDATAGTISTLTNNNFSNNTAVNGGAIFNSPNNSGTAQTNITGGTYSNNKATQRGGAIYNSTGKTTISGATFNSNNATVAGGAIYNISDNNMTINSSHFTGNSAAQGGGYL